ncbi:WD40-repeat-containing domain protein [Dichotomocladium elegans]|nr:WD40-repeat-containing domain protein [Dichotomocladium elegans]
MSQSPAAASSAAASVIDMITIKRQISASCAAAHPQFPFYITGCEVNGANDPSVILWQYGQEQEIAKYYGSHGKVTRVHFDHFGQRFGAGDTAGSLLLWRFDSHAHSNKPYYTISSAHTKATRDFTFLDSSSMIASVGTSQAMSRRRDHVCLWDTLLPPSKAMICSLPTHDSGAYAIAYAQEKNLLFTGGKRGEIAVSDIRQQAVVHTFTGHSARIRSITFDKRTNSLVTGSIDGDMKVWDASTYKQLYSCDVQPRNRFLAPGFNRFPLKAYGVTQIQFSNDAIYASGPGGLVRWTPKLKTQCDESS